MGAISGEVEYAAYATIVLLVARFTNPMSLITRPLMPALLDAVARSDAAWLINARSAVLLTVGISVVLTAVVGFFLPMVFVLLFPGVLQSVSEIEGYAIAAMLECDLGGRGTGRWRHRRVGEHPRCDAVRDGAGLHWRWCDSQLHRAGFAEGTFSMMSLDECAVPPGGS